MCKASQPGNLDEESQVSEADWQEQERQVRRKARETRKKYFLSKLDKLDQIAIRQGRNDEELINEREFWLEIVEQKR